MSAVLDDGPASAGTPSPPPVPDDDARVPGGPGDLATSTPDELIDGLTDGPPPSLGRFGRPARTIRAAVWPIVIATAVAVAGFVLWWTLPESVDGVVRYLAPLVAVAAARVLDVTLGVLRTVFVVTGRQFAAGAAATLEAGVWVAAAGFVFSDLTVTGGIAFAVGVGIGTVVGIRIVRAAALGLTTVRVFVDVERSAELAGWIRGQGHAVTVFYGEGRDGPRAMLLSIVRRKDAHRLAAAVDRRPSTFVTIDSDPAPGYAVHSAGRV